LHDFLKEDVHKWFPELENDVQITLVEAGKKLLSSFDAKLSDYTLSIFKKRRIETRTGVAVKKVEQGKIYLADDSIIDFELAVWSTGNSPTAFVKTLPFPKDRTGRLIVDSHMNIQNLSNVYAIGDCAAFEENPLAMTAQAAEQEGKYLAKSLNLKIANKEVPPFSFHFKGMFAYVGGKKALLDTPIGSSSGFLSWVVWNAAYITKLVSFRNKIMIPAYWFKSFLFGRDLSRF